jgi:hypothetical protein
MKKSFVQNVLEKYGPPDQTQQKTVMAAQTARRPVVRTV